MAQVDDPDLSAMFDLPTPPRPSRRARSRSTSLTPPRQLNRPVGHSDRVPLFMSADGSPEAEVRSGLGREGSVNEAWNGGQTGYPLNAVARAPPAPAPATTTTTANQSNTRPRPRLANQYRDHNPTTSIQRTRDQAMAIFDELDAEESGRLTSGQQGVGSGGGGGTGFDPLAFGASGGLNGTTNTGEGEPEIKKRRVMPKIDSARLLSDNGFPKLIKESKKFRIKGKGDEQSDLNNLLSMYQLWAHGMFPKATFKDTVNRIEKVCHQRDMQGKVREWKQEEYESRMTELRGTPTPPPPPPRRPETRIYDESEEEGGGGGGLNNRLHDHDPLVNNTTDEPSHAEEEEMDFDVDAMIALAEAEAEELQQIGGGGIGGLEGMVGTVNVVRSTLVGGIAEDDEEDWAAMDE